VLNNNAIATLTGASAKLFDIDTCPKATVATVVFAPIPPKCSNFFIFGKTPAKLPDEFEIQFLGISTEVFASVFARSNGATAPLHASNVVITNTFRSSELLCTNDP
jgi:hypothetical protein